MASSPHHKSPMEGKKRWQIIATVCLYFLIVSAVPIYTKKILAGSLGVKKFPYPAATGFLQLGFTAVGLFTFNVICRLSCSSTDRDRSWILGPHLMYKLQYTAIVGVLFGLKYAVTNWGLQLMAVGPHLLLQSTELLWCLLLAHTNNKEELGLIEMAAAFVSTCGTIMICKHALDTVDAPFVPLLVNLLSPLWGALTISFLRRGTKELIRSDNRFGGTFSPLEFTFFKAFFASITSLLMALMMENGVWRLEKGGKVAFWVALQEYTIRDLTLLFVVGGSLLLIMHLNLSWFTSLTSATHVATAQSVKVVPQWILNSICSIKVDLNPMNLCGAACVLVSSIVLAVSASYHSRLWGCPPHWEPRTWGPRTLKVVTPPDHQTTFLQVEAEDEGLGKVLLR